MASSSLSQNSPFNSSDSNPSVNLKDSDPHPWSFENDQIKSFTTNLPPGGYLPMHSHAPHLRLSLGRGHNRHTWPDQSVTEVIDQPGDYEWRDYLEHAVRAKTRKTAPPDQPAAHPSSRISHREIH